MAFGNGIGLTCAHLAAGCSFSGVAPWALSANHALPSFAARQADAALIFIDPVRAVEFVRIFSDLCVWGAVAAICVILMRVAWKLRNRFPFLATGITLPVILIGLIIKRALDFQHLRTTLHPGNLHYTLVASLLSLVLSLCFIVLSPYLRKVLEFSLTADEQHERFITAADTSLHAFYMLDIVRTPFRGVTDFRFSFANAMAASQLGTAREKLVGRSLLELLPHAHDSGVFRHLKHVAQTGQPFHARIKDRNHLGQELWIHMRVVRTSSGLAVVTQDLSEDQRRQRRLEELNRFSQSIINDAPFSIIAVDINGIITAVNGATQILTQYRREELVGRHSIIMLHDPAELSARSIELSHQLGSPVQAGFETIKATLGQRKSNEGEWNYVRKDGNKIAVHLALTALRDPSNEITGYLAIAFDVSERKALTDSISFMAHHDPLTRLPNRTLLNQRLEEALQHAATIERRVAVFAIDVDHFKRINDSLGHIAGDELLTLVADRLKQAVRTTDLVARTGGDEFIVMMPNAGEVEDVMRSGQRLLRSLQAPVHIAGREINVTGSVGMCLFPDLAQDSGALVRNADHALYAAKQKGRNNFHAFSEKMLEATADRLEMEADLRHALGHEELELYYQPQVNVRTQEITGVEALLRWHHPVRGMVPPSKFIQIAEEGGMIVPIGEWVLRHGCMEVKRIQNQIGKRFTLAINLSPRQILQENLYDVVAEALETSGLAPGDLELEITENTLMITSTETLATLARIRELGVRLAVDDFGTGFSSFQYILEYKVDRLKIDRSFTSKCATDANAGAIVRTVIAMAHGLNMTVVAEGVESEEQLAFLLRRRCDEAQGFRFGRPMPSIELRRILTDPAPFPPVATIPAENSTHVPVALPKKAIAVN